MTTALSSISVIVPSYNRAGFLPETLDRILAQTRSPDEIIVADDGSTDHTATVVEAYGDRVRHLPLLNGGAAAARHAGVSVSRGEVIAFCDSDDLWLPDHLSALSRALQEAPFAFANFVIVQGSDWQRQDKFSTAPSSYWRCLDRELSDGSAVADKPLYPSIIAFQPIFPSCTAMTRRFYDEIGGYRREFGRLPSEDLEFTLRCVCRAPTAVVRQATVGIRKHGGNHSGDAQKQLGGEIHILDWSRDHHPIDPAWRAAIDGQIAQRAEQFFDLAFAACDLESARGMATRVPHRPGAIKLRIKRAILSLPDRLAAPLCRRLVGSS